MKPLVLASIIGFFLSYICLCQDCLKMVIKNENELQMKMDIEVKCLHKPIKTRGQDGIFRKSISDIPSRESSRYHI